MRCGCGGAGPALAGPAQAGEPVAAPARDLTSLSNPYLSQIERGLHQPSVRVLRLLADALNVSAETLLAEAGLLEHAADAARGEAQGRRGSVESVIPGRCPARR